MLQRSTQQWELLGDRRKPGVLSTSHWLALAYPKKWSLSRVPPELSFKIIAEDFAASWSVVQKAKSLPQYMIDRTAGNVAIKCTTVKGFAK
jgi:hypothetical protein